MIACPYNIPRVDKKTKLLVKCTMCFDRVKNGLLPACVKTCPTGAMSFGDRNEILDKAQKRLAEVKKKYPQASLLDADDVRVIYLVLEDRKSTINSLRPRKGGSPARRPCENYLNPFRPWLRRPPHGRDDPGITVKHKPIFIRD